MPGGGPSSLPSSARPRGPCGNAPRRGAGATASQAHASVCSCRSAARHAARHGREEPVRPAAAHPAHASASSFQ
eukprot:3126643-Lingulodinium_polyedra.AAC.1